MVIYSVVVTISSFFNRQLVCIKTILIKSNMNLINMSLSHMCLHL